VKFEEASLRGSRASDEELNREYVTRVLMQALLIVAPNWSIADGPREWTLKRPR